MAAELVSLGAALAWARPQIARIDARLLLCHVTGRVPSYLIAYPETALASDDAARFAALVARRVRGEPVAYLVGSREFYGRAFRVTPDVLIPRPETELVIEIAQAAFAVPPQKVLDLGTGSGALAVTLAKLWPDASVLGVDCSPAALAIARDNAQRLGARAVFLQSDWFSALDAAARFDLVVANPPYVAATDPHLAQGDVRFEPSSALAAGADGLDDIRRIAAGVAACLAPGGCVLVEHGYDQAAAVRALLAKAGLARIRSWQDLAGIERVSGGWLDAPAREA